MLMELPQDYLEPRKELFRESWLAVTVESTLVWHVMPCGQVEVYRRFVGNCCPIFKSRTM
jgi:hypothetical protein